MTTYRGILDGEGRPVYPIEDIEGFILGPYTKTYADLAAISATTGDLLLYTTVANNEVIGPVYMRVTTSFTGAMGAALDSVSVGVSGAQTKYYDLSDCAAGVGGSGGVRPKVGTIEPTAGTEIRAYFEDSALNLMDFTAGSVTFWLQRYALP